MHSVTIVATICGLFVLQVLAAPQEFGDHYITKYDNIDVENILSNPKLFNNYAKCLTNEGPCTSDGDYMKSVVPDALENGCKRCSEKQKNGVIRVLRYVKDNRDDVWQKIATIYDPQGIYIKKFKEQYPELVHTKKKRGDAF